MQYAGGAQKIKKPCLYLFLYGYSDYLSISANINKFWYVNIGNWSKSTAFW